MPKDFVNLTLGEIKENLIAQVGKIITCFTIFCIQLTLLLSHSFQVEARRTFFAEKKKHLMQTKPVCRFLPSGTSCESMAIYQKERRRKAIIQDRHAQRKKRLKRVREGYNYGSTAYLAWDLGIFGR